MGLFALGRTSTVARRSAFVNGAVFWVIGIAVIGGLIYFLRTDKQKSAVAEAHQVSRRSFSVMLNEKGELEAKKSTDVKVEVEGRSTIIWLIDEGAQVEKGDLIARIASNEIEERIQAEDIKAQNAKAAAEAADQQFEIMLDQNQSDIRKARLALTNAEIEQRKYLEGDSVQMLNAKENALRTAKIRLEQAQDVLKDSRALHDKGHLSKLDFERDILSEIEAKDAVEAAELDLKTFKTYTMPKELAQKASDVDEARKDLERTIKKAEATEMKDRAQTAAKHAEYTLVAERLEKLREQRVKTELRAPSSGMVVYDTGPNRWNRREVAEGAEVIERQTVVKLPDPSQMIVKLRIHEAKTSLIAVGQKARVEVEGIPDVLFDGTVTKIAPLADSQNNWLNPDMKEYATEIELDTNNYELKPGVTARADILVKNVDNALTVPVQAVYSVGERHFVFNGKSQTGAKPKEIVVGAANDSFVEVSSGLSEGDWVLLAVDDSLLAALPNPVEQPDEFERSKPKHKANGPAEGGGKGRGDRKNRGGAKMNGKTAEKSEKAAAKTSQDQS
ncbi:MAG: efflux RND transporter periplasmic adaptor subunit [Phycisphaerae bacterium]